jgi:hypothetical protein
MTAAASVGGLFAAPAIDSACPLVPQFEISVASVAFAFQRMIL